jgi:hypothetical protein
MKSSLNDLFRNKGIPEMAAPARVTSPASFSIQYQSVHFDRPAAAMPHSSTDFAARTLKVSPDPSQGSRPF